MVLRTTRPRICDVTQGVTWVSCGPLLAARNAWKGRLSSEEKPDSWDWRRPQKEDRTRNVRDSILPTFFTRRGFPSENDRTGDWIVGTLRQVSLLDHREPLRNQTGLRILNPIVSHTWTRVHFGLVLELDWVLSSRQQIPGDLLKHGSLLSKVTLGKLMHLTPDPSDTRKEDRKRYKGNGLLTPLVLQKPVVIYSMTLRQRTFTVVPSDRMFWGNPLKPYPERTGPYPTVVTSTGSIRRLRQDGYWRVETPGLGKQLREVRKRRRGDILRSCKSVSLRIRPYSWKLTFQPFSTPSFILLTLLVMYIINSMRLVLKLFENRVFYVLLVLISYIISKKILTCVWLYHPSYTTLFLGLVFRFSSSPH